MRDAYGPGNIKPDAPNLGNSKFGAPVINGLESGVLKFKDPRTAALASNGPFMAINAASLGVFRKIGRDLSGVMRRDTASHSHLSDAPDMRPAQT